MTSHSTLVRCHKDQLRSVDLTRAIERPLKSDRHISHTDLVPAYSLPDATTLGKATR